MTYFRFDSARQFMGTATVVANMLLARDGDEFTGVAEVRRYDVGGNLVSADKTSERGRRIRAESIPDQPQEQ